MFRTLDDADQQMLEALGDDELSAAAIVVVCVALLFVVLAGFIIFTRFTAL